LERSREVGLNIKRKIYCNFLRDAWLINDDDENNK